MRFWRKKPAEQSLEAAESTAPEDGDAERVLEPTEEEKAEVHEQTERAVERTRRGFFSRLGGLFERPDFDDALRAGNFRQQYGEGRDEAFGIRSTGRLQAVA